ncbi:hypothetical protein [Mucilaginibacter sp. CSA2-8R]|uniref:hypothetical protein n=1 Tax=Mucilaginibacter sp. CSA2-8R TaxID=3141542 RepID=UPI00315D02BD
MDFSNIALAGLILSEGAQNPSGIEEDAWFIPYAWIADLKVPVTNPATAVEAMTITGNHVLKAGKSPIPLFTAQDKSGMDSALVGEKYSKMFQPNVKLFQPQPTVANAANFAIVANLRGIFLIKRPGDEFFTQVGTKGLLATVKEGSVKFGDGPTGAPGIEFVGEAASVMPFYIYKGELPAAA